MPAPVFQMQVMVSLVGTHSVIGECVDEPARLGPAVYDGDT